MSKIVSIHSFRGGTGKSNIAANLAIIIAQQGQRVGVIDTDVQSPGIHILFGLDEEKMGRALNDYLRGKCAVEEAAYDVGESEIEDMVRLASAGIFCLRYPDHPVTQELHRIAVRITT